MDTHDASHRWQQLRQQVANLRASTQTAVDAASPVIARVHPSHRDGADNLVRYLAVRAHDQRGLQQALSNEGLSSLGRMEPDVDRNLRAISRILTAALDPPTPLDPETDTRAERDLTGVLRANAERLLGPPTADRPTRIMVTMPTAAASDPTLARAFCEAGMDVARINCAHDDPDAWLLMAQHVRHADARVRIATDLGGPKVRTTSFAPGPRVRKVAPIRDALGRVTVPASVWLVGPDAEASQTAEGCIPVTDAAWIAARRVHDTVEFTDTRGRTRYMTVTACDGGSARIEGDRTAYFGTDTVLDVEGSETSVGSLPEIPGMVRVAVDDVIELRASIDGHSVSEHHHVVGCTLPEALTAVRSGDRVLFDDGKIEGFVQTVNSDAAARSATVVVTHAAPAGTKLRAHKGINFPDTDLPVPALTPQDRAALDAVLEFTDIVQLSFVRSATDVRALLELLEQRDAHTVGVVVKIETVRAFRGLPEILLELMRWPAVGVMIARGDLGVEAGWERLAEVQEEILWLCEAAHIPVIWATQVLDALAGSGVPTRAEVTDAAAGERAECVMLNKGPHIEDAIVALADILRRMEGHVHKKRPLLRRLKAWSPEP